MRRKTKMLRPNQTQTNFFSILYDRIPEDHLLKRIASAVDFSFINELVADSYCATFGRPAKEPELMAKLCILERLYDLSDVKVIEEANCNLAYLWFLGLNPDDPLPDPSLLAKFRTQRLKDISLDEILAEIVRQCVEKGIIKGTTLAVDTTHTEANCKKQVPERVMKHLAAKIFAALEADHDGKLPDDIDTNIPDYKGIEDHKEAKRVMKEYLEKTVETAEPHAGFATKEVIREVKDILSDEKFILQKGLRSLVDQDARIGYKSKTDSFFGYKTEYTMTTDERIITALDVHSGEYVDGTGFHELLERTEAAGVKVEAVTGDKAYFRKDILDELEQKKIESIIPVSAVVYHVDEDLFSYNKDSDEWFCRIGNRTVKKKQKLKNNALYFTYTFDKDGCKDCPHRAECMGRATGGRRFSISSNTPAYYQESQRQKSPEFQEKYKKRAAEEWKNAEMKRFHGMARAKGWGLRSMTFQAKFTAIAVDLKRIANLIREKEKEKTGCNALAFSIFSDLWQLGKLKIVS
jgi:transposase/hydroxymethylpyrimidine pyrophosphatase-like HAD family hydrolase